ncbi:MAG: hypothetical protein ACOY16_09780 [Chloroflexota bacterium]
MKNSYNQPHAHEVAQAISPRPVHEPGLPSQPAGSPILDGDWLYADAEPGANRSASAKPSVYYAPACAEHAYHTIRSYDNIASTTLI